MYVVFYAIIITTTGSSTIVTSTKNQQSQQFVLYMFMREIEKSKLKFYNNGFLDFGCCWP